MKNPLRGGVSRGQHIYRTYVRSLEYERLCRGQASAKAEAVPTSMRT